MWSNALERIRVQVTETWKNSQVFHPPLWLKQRKGRQLSWNVKAEALLKPRVELQVLISKTYNTLWESSVGTLMGEARNSQRREGGKRPGLVEPTGFWWSPQASGGWTLPPLLFFTFSSRGISPGLRRLGSAPL